MEQSAQASSQTLTSPLQEVEKESLSELFARDPESLSEADLDRIVSELRSKRMLWLQTEEAGKKKKAEPKAKPKTLSKEELNSLLDEL